MFQPDEFLDASQTEHWDLFKDLEAPWQALPQIASYLKTHLRPALRGKIIGQPFLSENIFIGEGTVIYPGAVLIGPAWIGQNCEIRPGAYIRENVIAGDGCVLGNSCEFKNSVLFNQCQVPHFSYVGDSILGARVHLGAGVILSNLKLHGSLISVHHDGQAVSTGLRKFGAVIGDDAEVGCNAVLNPGSVLGRRSLIYPGLQWRGVLRADAIAKASRGIEVTDRKPAG